jgi:hypothetical protein
MNPRRVLASVLMSILVTGTLVRVRRRRTIWRRPAPCSTSVPIRRSAIRGFSAWDI